MTTALQQLLIGISAGSVYALVAAGLALLFGTAGLLNFAHGDLVMVGAIATWVFVKYFDVSYLVAGLMAIVCVAVLGEMMRRVTGLRTDKSFESLIVLTLAASLIFQQVVILTAGANAHLVRGLAPGTRVGLAGVSLSIHEVTLAAVCVVTLVVLDFIVRRTTLGKIFNAMAQSRRTASLLGIRVEFYAAIALAISAVLAGVGGVLIAPVLGANYSMGLNLLIIAFASVVVGGVGNIRGAALAALIIGIAQTFTAQYIGFVYSPLVAYIIMFVAVLYRESGLFRAKAKI